MSRFGVIGAPVAAAGLRVAGVSVVAGGGAGFMVDVQMIRRSGRIDGLVVGDGVRRWVPVMRWVSSQGVPVVFERVGESAQEIVERLLAGGEPTVTSPDVPSIESGVADLWLPPTKKDVR